MRRSLAVSAAVLVAVASVPTIAGPVWARPRHRDASDGAVTVRVIQAVDATGTYSPVLEPGIAGVTVDLSDGSGNTISGTTASDGTVTLIPSASSLTGGRYRVQVVNPKPGVLFPAFASSDTFDPANPNQLSSNEEFVDLHNGRNVSYTTGLWYPEDYCQKNAPLATACIRNGTEASTTRTLVAAPYNVTGDNQQVSQLGTNADTGALFGVAWSKPNKWVFSSALAHRNSVYGPGGQGGIYVTPVSVAYSGNPGTPTVTPNQAPSLFATVPDAGTTAHNNTPPAATSSDAAFIPAVGKESLGDLVVSDDGKDLYVVNLKDRKLYRYDATQMTASAPKGSWTIPDPGCASADDWRPFGLGYRQGVLYVGGVCSAESTQQASDLKAVIQTFDPSSDAFTGTVLDQPLSFPRRASDGLQGTCPGKQWYPWTDTFPTTCGARMAWPEPELGHIAFEVDGSMLVGFRDRFGDQWGLNEQESTTNGTTVDPVIGGDLYAACQNGGAGNFVFDVNGGCGMAGNGTRTYDITRGGALHPNSLQGGIAVSKVEQTNAGTMIDAWGPGDWSSGIGFTYRNLPFPNNNPNPGQPYPGYGNRLMVNGQGFGKGGSMASLAVLCDQAPIQIGNRVWYNTTKNGIQEPAPGLPGEAPVVGATVNLYDNTGALVASKKTNSRGEYYFDSIHDGLQFKTQYRVAIDNPADYAEGGPLYQWSPTIPNVPGNTFINSKGVVPAGGRFPETMFTTGGPGQNNHTYDFGYFQPTGELKVLKVDSKTKAPIAGATFQLWRETNGTDGLQTTGASADTAVGKPCRTGANGLCSSGQQPLGTYYWQETAPPPGYGLPKPAIFGPLTLTTTNWRTGVQVTAADPPNTPPPPPPNIKVDKYDKASGQEADTPDTAVNYKNNETRTIAMPVTNNGGEPLVQVRVTDRTFAGNIKIRNFHCRFPDKTVGYAVTQPDGSQRIDWANTWTNPPKSSFAVGATFPCEATLTMPAGAPLHGDIVQADGVGKYSRKPVHDRNKYHATVRRLARTGADDVILIGEFAGGSLLVGAAVLVGNVIVSRRRRATGL